MCVVATRLLALVVVAHATACTATSRSASGTAPARPDAAPSRLHNTCDLHPSDCIPQPKGWVHELESGGRCIAWPHVYEDGCAISTTTERVKGTVTDVFDGEQRLGCGDQATICGRAFKCLCPRCSAVPDYATRMRRVRLVRFERRERSLDLTVEYADGKCEVSGVAPKAGEGSCSAVEGDRSEVGGCLRATRQDFSVRCGESQNVCNGTVLRCECPADGEWYLSVDGKR